jgi:hypothetical protein
VAREKPEVGPQVEFRAHMALAVLSAILGDRHDAIEHQHRRQGQLRIALPEQLAAAAGQKLFVAEARLPDHAAADALARGIECSAPSLGVLGPQ